VVLAVHTIKLECYRNWHGWRMTCDFVKHPYFCGILFSLNNNAILSQATTWKNFENIVLGEISHTPKDICCMILWVTHQAGMGFDLVVIVPPTTLLWLLCLGCGVSFFGGFQHLSINDFSTDSCNFGAFRGGDEHTSFYFSSLNQKYN